MSKKASPAVVGGFVIGSIALVVAGVLAFSSGALFSQTYPALAVFRGSVAGLQVGSPVEFRGVQVGTVKRISLLFNAENMTVTIPVYMDLNFAPATEREDAREGPLTQAEFKLEARAAISAGLRARLKLKSIVTGQLGVELDFIPDTPQDLSGIVTDAVEIPTAASPLERVTSILERLPLEELVGKMMSTADGIERLVNSEDLRLAVQNANLALRDARTLIQDTGQTMMQARLTFESINNKVDPLSGAALATIKRADQSLANAEQALGELRTLVKETQVNVDEVSDSAVAAFDQAQQTLRTTDELIDADSPTRHNLDVTLEELAAAARAVRVMAEFLEQHPDALIRGKNF